MIWNLINGLIWNLVNGLIWNLVKVAYGFQDGQKQCWFKGSAPTLSLIKECMFVIFQLNVVSACNLNYWYDIVIKGFASLISYLRHTVSNGVMALRRANIFVAAVVIEKTCTVRSLQG